MYNPGGAGPQTPQAMTDPLARRARVTICGHGMTTREKAHAKLDQLPEDRVDAALAALEAVEGRDTSVEAILARHGERRLSPQEFDSHFGSLPTDDEG